MKKRLAKWAHRVLRKYGFENWRTRFAYRVLEICGVEDTEEQGLSQHRLTPARAPIVKNFTKSAPEGDPALRHYAQTGSKKFVYFFFAKGVDKTGFLCYTIYRKREERSNPNVFQL